ncbi:MAG: GrpB family protein, partial [Bdellovibrionota bacterium]
MKHVERLKLFTENSIGLKRGNVELVPHNPEWTRLFSAEANLVSEQLRIEEMRLYHCGSTSITGISAKPIIDIVGSVPSISELDSKKPLLEEIGYEYKGEYGIPGRRYSVLYDPQKLIGYVHLHLFAHLDPEVEKHLLFRDFLRANVIIAKEYEADKIRLVGSNTPRSS